MAIKLILITSDNSKDFDISFSCTRYYVSFDEISQNKKLNIKTEIKLEEKDEKRIDN